MSLDKHAPPNEGHKITKRQAQYEPLGGTPQQRCGNCTMFMRAQSGCTLVEGHIAPGAVCEFWERN